MVGQNGGFAAVLVGKNQGQWLARSKVDQINKVNAVMLSNGVIVRVFGKGQREHTLLFEVGFVNARKALDQHRAHAKVPWLHGRMLARRTFSVVMVAYH